MIPSLLGLLIDLFRQSFVAQINIDSIRFFFIVSSAQSSSNDQQTQSGARWSLNDFEQFFRSFEIVDFDLFVPTPNDESTNPNDADMS